MTRCRGLMCVWASSCTMKQNGCSRLRQRRAAKAAMTPSSLGPLPSVGDGSAIQTLAMLPGAQEASDRKRIFSPVPCSRSGEAS